MNDRILEADGAHLSNPLPLKKHSYPKSVNCLAFFLIILFLILIPRFLYVDLPLLREVKANMDQADSLFDKEDYMLAGMLYDAIYKKYPTCRKAHIRVIQSCFGLVVEDKDFYLSGLSYIEGEKFTQKEFKEIEFFLPDRYKKGFCELFKFNSSTGK